MNTPAMSNETENYQGRNRKERETDEKLSTILFGLLIIFILIAAVLNFFVPDIM